MKTQSKTLQESDDDEPLSAHPKSKLSIISFVLGLLGSIIYWSSLLIGFYLMMAGGGLDIMNFPSQELTFVMYGSLICSAVGGIFGAVGLLRDENLVLNTISFTL
jgi:hypothetical protein